MNKNIFIIICVTLLFPKVVFGANIFFDNKDKIFSSGRDFVVDIYLDTEGQSINTLEGKISYPKDLLDIKEVRDGNSVVNFWVEKPVDLKNGEIKFAGIIPGGVTGQKMLLFSLVLHPFDIGSGSLSLDNAQVFLNDGLGTKVNVSKSSFSFSILTPGETDGRDLQVESVIDNDPPEVFRPEIAKDENMFDGQYFLVFVAQDKGSGMDHYEVKEGFWGKYIEVESPYLLQNQSLSKRIYVKAVDKEGNKRVSIYKPENLPFYNNYLLMVTIFVSVILGYVIIKKCLKYIRQS